MKPDYAIRSAAMLTALAFCAVCGCARHDQLPIDPETDIRNFARVDDGLYRGGQPYADEFDRLADLGIRTVISLRIFDVDRGRLAGHGFRYLHISFKAGHPEDEDVVEFLQAATDPANQPVYVHCKWGADRTGMMIAVYRMVVQGWSREAAVDEMYRMGFDPIWLDINEYLEEFDPDRIRRLMAETPPQQLEIVR